MSSRTFQPKGKCHVHPSFDHRIFLDHPGFHAASAGMELTIVPFSGNKEVTSMKMTKGEGSRRDRATVLFLAAAFI
jgi:hypothetical protein